MTESERLKEDQKAVVEQVINDFKRRQEERRIIERGWQLAVNFLGGNQYCDVNGLGELEERDGGYYWQERRVYNYIAPMLDMRRSKLTAVRPKLSVLAASDDEEDRRAARLASAILRASYEDSGLDDALIRATNWSETCGTAFYKIIWDSDSGREIGKTFDGASVREGKVKVMAVSPFEIYPDSLSEEDLYSQPSIIHARAVPAEDIYAAYGVEVAGRDVDEYAAESGGIRRTPVCDRGFSAVKHGYEVVIERYERPNSKYPDGRLTIVAGDSLLYDGALPYVTGENGARTYPFAMQRCQPLPGCFFGASVVDRLIPVQRAYNAVKNRKQEFLNRISMGMLAVEEGSVDTDELTEDGLVPGKIIVYRQGGTPPEMLTLGSVPAEFSQEEARLEEEFYKISGVYDVLRKSAAFSGVTSATGLKLLLEQEDARLGASYDQIRQALKIIGKFILRLYRQFASSVRLMRYSGKGDALSVVCFKGSDITGDDVVLDADSDLTMTPARKRAAIYEMMDKGLFAGEDGGMTNGTKVKLLDALGFNGAMADRDLEGLHSERAAKENESLKKGGGADVKDYDDHAVHVREHTAFLLGEKLDKEAESAICAHLKQHEKKLKESKYEG